MKENMTLTVVTNKTIVKANKLVLNDIQLLKL